MQENGGGIPKRARLLAEQPPGSRTDKRQGPPGCCQHRSVQRTAAQWAPAVSGSPQGAVGCKYACTRADQTVGRRGAILPLVAAGVCLFVLCVYGVRSPLQPRWWALGVLRHHAEASDVSPSIFRRTRRRTDGGILIRRKVRRRSTAGPPVPNEASRYVDPGHKAGDGKLPVPFMCSMLRVWILARARMGCMVQTVDVLLMCLQPSSRCRPLGQWLAECASSKHWRTEPCLSPNPSQDRRFPVSGLMGRGSEAIRDRSRPDDEERLWRL